MGKLSCCQRELLARPSGAWNGSPIVFCCACFSQTKNAQRSSKSLNVGLAHTTRVQSIAARRTANINVSALRALKY
jgi:hypothetical protein